MTQRVIFKNFFSFLIRVSCVPQRSHLGPLLFTLFIIDLPLILTNSRVLMYNLILMHFKLALCGLFSCKPLIHRLYSKWLKVGWRWVFMDSKFSDHINKTVNIARGVLRFIKRWSKEMNDLAHFISPTNSWILRSRLEPPIRGT